MTQEEARLVLSLLVAIIMKHGGSMKISMQRLKALAGRKYSFEWDVDATGDYGTLRATFEPQVIDMEVTSCTNLQ